ncbi:MAG TPA: hypothetical protein VFK06_13905 [Candidatus Angelobacter sp.]|nr:hypothetical protein [Candidatus Angelobacter sp.]
MRNRFIDAKTRIDWAKKDIAKFERKARNFFKNTPYGLVIEPEPDGIHELHKFRLAKKIPPVLTRHTVYAIENLRHALDLAAVEVGRLCNATNVGDVHFPFCKTKADIKSRINSVACKELPDEIKTLFSSFEPYNGGNDLLWAINELCNTSKHRLILPIAGQTGVNIPLIETASLITHPIEIIDGVSNSIEDEVVYARTQLGMKWKHRVQVAIGIAFGKVEVVEGKPVYVTLREMLRIVSEIVSATENECHRLGLFDFS